MDFPPFELVKLASRDLTGPGVEFFARRVSASAATASFSAAIAADQFSSERLYMLHWAWSLLPAAAQRPLGVRWYLQLPTIDLLLFGDVDKSAEHSLGSAGIRVDGKSEALVVPGGKGMLFVADMVAGAAGSALDGWLWGYSFPKGNVLSF